VAERDLVLKVKLDNTTKLVRLHVSSQLTMESVLESVAAAFRLKKKVSLDVSLGDIVASDRKMMKCDAVLAE